MICPRWTGRRALATTSPELCLSVAAVALLMGRCFVDYFLIGLAIEGYYIGPKYNVFWDDFIVETMNNVFWGVIPFSSSSN
jgi:hypothetical protein